MENLTLTISQHARERFAERIMNKDEKSDIASYVAQNEQIIDNMTEKAVNELISDRIDAAITVAIDKLVKKKVFEILGLEREPDQKDDLEEH